MNALYQMLLKEAAQPAQSAKAPQAAQATQAPQRASTPPAAQAQRPTAAPPTPAKVRSDRYTMGPTKSDVYTLGPAPAQAAPAPAPAPAQAAPAPAQAAPAQAQAAPAQAVQAAPAQAAPAPAAPAQAAPAAETPARHPLSYIDGTMTRVRQARANAHTHFTPENLQTLRDTRDTVGKWGRRAATVGAIGAGLAVGKRVLDDGPGAEQDARMRDYLASTQHQMTGALPGMQVYGSYEAFGAAKLAEIDAMEKRAEPSYPYPYAQSAHAAMSAEFGKALAQKLVSEPIDIAHRFLKKKLVDDPKADAVFQTVINEDPMLREAYAQNPVPLQRSFATIRKMSPSIATLHGPVQSFLRHATITGGPLDLAAVRQLAETQRFHQSAKNGV